MDVLEKIVSTIETNKQREQAGSNNGLLGGLAVIVAIVVALAVLGISAWSKGKERAKLLHQEALREEAEHKAQVEAQMAASEETRQQALQEAAKAQNELEELQAQREQIEHEHAEVMDRINSIVSWDDVDNYLGS